MSEQAADELRDPHDLVWQGLMESDAQSRYYGYLAGRITFWNKFFAWLGCFLAVVSALVLWGDPLVLWGDLLVLDDPTVLAIVLVLITGAISAIGAVQGAQAQVAMAVYCQKRFGDLHVDWKALWHELPTLDSSEAVARWAELSRLGNDTTALSPVNTVNKKLHRRSQAETKKLFWARYHLQSASDNDRQALPQA